MPCNPMLLGLAAVAFAAATLAYAHDAKGRADKAGKPAAPIEQKAFGRAGDPARVGRTISIVMTDEMRFKPDAIRVRLGETVRFTHFNSGRVMHEMVIGTPAELREHAELMKRFPDMEHDEPHMAHVAPGGRGEIVWQFNRGGEFQFACLIPGHYEAGMVGRITVETGK